MNAMERFYLHLIADWRRTLRKAWSIRFILIAGALSGAEMVLPMFTDALPRGVLSPLIFLSTNLAFVSRVIVQRNMRNEDT